MSLYKDASLVMIPTAYKDGKLYSIRPVPEYGSELITNGDFATDSGWNKGSGWTISGGKANASSATSDFTQTISYTLGKTYRISYTISNYSSGSVRTLLGAYIAGASRSSNGTYIEDITPTNPSSNSFLYFEGLSGFSGSIDNVSVQEIVSSGDFTFSRGSNLAATRVASSGYIEKGRENLLLQSNQFDTTWLQTNTTLTSGQSGYDGNNAWKVASASGGQTGMQQSVSFSNINTFSIYAKAGNVDFIKLFVVQSGTNRTCVIDLSDGSIASDNSFATSNPAASVTSLTNGWYRIEMPTNANSATFVRIRPHLSEGDDNLSVGDFIYIQDAQLEQGLVATDYIETGTSAAQSGILEDMPRLDYSGGASCPSLLLEPSRTNVIPYSEYINGSGWTKSSGVVITDNAAQSPEGLNNASYVQFGAASKLIAISTSLSTGVSCSSSCYIKGTAGETIKIAAGGVDSSNITLTGEWQRIEHTATSINSSFNINTFGGVTARNVYIFGAMMEAGSYPTSYIPTFGSSVTRSGDSWNANNIGIESAYTIFIDYKDLSQADSNFEDYISFQESNSNQNGLRAEGVGSQWRLYGYNITGGVSFPITGNISARKKAIVLSSEGIKLFEDGVLVDSDLNGITSLPPLNSIVSKRGTSAPYPTEIRQLYNQLAIFPTALTDSECIALTTL